MITDTFRLESSELGFCRRQSARDFTWIYPKIAVGTTIKALVGRNERVGRTVGYNAGDIDKYQPITKEI